MSDHLTTHFAQYADFVRGVGEWMDRPDLEDVIPDFIYLAECELQLELNFALSDARKEGTTIVGQDYIDLPNDYAEGFNLEWETRELPHPEVVTKSHWEGVKKRLEGQPTRASMFHGNRIYFAPAPRAAGCLRRSLRV